jgi:biopolymer transport protein ExbD
MTTASQKTVQPTAQAMYDATRKRRLSKRRGRKSEGEISDLNITPMLDMMTILLVFLLKSFASSAENVNVANLTLPHSTTKLKVEDALQLMITPSEVLLDQKVIVKLDGKGGILPEDLPEGIGGFLVKPLYDVLEVKSGYYKSIEKYGGTQFIGRIAVIADKSIAYTTIFKILYTVGRAEFGRFRLFVQKPPEG